MSIRRGGARETTCGGRERSMIQIARRSGRAGLPIRVTAGFHVADHDGTHADERPRADAESEGMMAPCADVAGRLHLDQAADD